MATRQKTGFSCKELDLTAEQSLKPQIPQMDTWNFHRVMSKTSELNRLS